MAKIAGCEHDATRCCDACAKARARAGFLKYMAARKGSEPQQPKPQYRPADDRRVPRDDPRWGWGY